MFFQALLLALFAICCVNSYSDDAMPSNKTGRSLGPDGGSRESRISQIIQFVRERKYDHAKELINRLSFQESIQTVSVAVKNMYTRNVGIEAIFLFLLNMSQCTQATVGYRSLWEVIKENGDQGKPEILILDGIAASFVCPHEFLGQLRNELKTPVRNVIADYASQIRLQNFANILELFSKYKTDTNMVNALTSALPEIVSVTYSKDINNVKNIISFLNKLPLCSQTAEGYKSLFIEMLEFGQQTFPEIVLLQGSHLECDIYFNELQKSMQVYIKDVISKWATLIRSGNSKDVNDFFVKYNDSSTRYALNVTLSELVTLTFDGNENNTKNLIQFLNKLPSCEYVVDGYKILYRVMRESGLKGTPSIFFQNGTNDQQCGTSLFGDLDSSNLISSWASQIRSGNYSGASENFLKYNSNNFNLADLLNMTYDANVNNVKNILSFLQNLPNCSQIEEGYKSLYSIMKETGHEKKPEILLLIGVNRTCDSSFSSLRTELNETIMDMIAEWSAKLLSGDYDNIRDFFFKYNNDSHSLYALDIYLTNFLIVTYNESRVGIDILLRFITSLPYHNMVLGLNIIYSEMERKFDQNNYQDVFKWAYSVNWVLIKGNDTDDMKEALIGLSKKPPLLIQKIVRGDTCAIKIVLYGEYLHQSESVFVDGSNGERQLFTWMLKYAQFSQERWKFETKDNGTQFQILSENSTPTVVNKYLYLVLKGDENFEKYKRTVVAVKDLNRYKHDAWNLEAIHISNATNEANGLFYIRSGTYFLYAGDDTQTVGSQRRGVFAFMGTSKDVPLFAQWEVDCL